MRAGLIQMTAGDDPAANLRQTQDQIASAARQGAEFVLTPEVTNCISQSKAHQQAVLQTEDEDQTLAALRCLAETLKIHLLIGSLALKTNDPDGRFANRSFLIGPTGGIFARYDKIHMFDVDVSKIETYRESTNYRPGNTAEMASVGPMMLGLTICYDLRFPLLFRRLAKAGAHMISVPSAFSAVTGAAHWEALLRARAIETGCYILAPAQTGTHPAAQGALRKTHGHSMVVAPWGEVMLDAGLEPGVHIVELDPSAVQTARQRVPSLLHDRDFSGP